MALLANPSTEPQTDARGRTLAALESWSDPLGRAITKPHTSEESGGVRGTTTRARAAHKRTRDVPGRGVRVASTVSVTSLDEIMIQSNNGVAAKESNVSDRTSSEEVERFILFACKCSVGIKRDESGLGRPPSSSGLTTADNDDIFNFAKMSSSESCRRVPRFYSRSPWLSEPALELQVTQEALASAGSPPRSFSRDNEFGGLPRKGEKAA
ncbi:unnamed protein product [Lampetra planeri]